MICKGCKNEVPHLDGEYWDCPKCRKKKAKEWAVSLKREGST